MGGVVPVKSLLLSCISFAFRFLKAYPTSMPLPSCYLYLPMKRIILTSLLALLYLSFTLPCQAQTQVKTFYEDFRWGSFTGTMENIYFSVEGIQLEPGVTEGRIESDIIPAPIPFSGVSVKINATMPEGSQLEVYVRASPDAYNWSNWVLLGGEDFPYEYEGELLYSHLYISHEDSYWLQYSIKLIANKQDKPTLRSLAIEFYPGHGGLETEIVAALPRYPNAVWVGPPASGNFEYGRRGRGVNKIIIHTIEGNAQSALDRFKTPGEEASAHYIVRMDGIVWQVVENQDTAYHAGNLDYNLESIGIELEGWADGDPNVGPGKFHWQTTAQYNALQNLINWLRNQFGSISLDRAHIIGHNQVPGVNVAECAGPDYWGGCKNKHDPGAWWNWKKLMGGLGRTPDYKVVAVQTTCSVRKLPQSNAPYITTVWQGQKFVAYDFYNGWYLIFLSGKESAQPYKGAGEYHWDGWVPASCVSLEQGATQLEVIDVFPDRLMIRDNPNGNIIGRTINGKRYVATGNVQNNWYEYYIAWDTYPRTGWSSGQYLDLIAAPSQPDLVVTSLSGPSTGTIGGTINISSTIANQGPANAGSFHVGYYFSLDSTITPSDPRSATTCDLAGLSANTSQQCTRPISVPSSLSPGTYYLGAIADYLNTVTESNENNNTRAADGQITLTSSVCTYSISPPSANFPASGGSGSFGVTTGSGCSWTASTSESWITITSGSGTGSGTVYYTVASNPNTTQRTGTITVQGHTHTVYQEGSPPPCTDNDVDGYYGQAGCGTAVDCNDNDNTVYPGAPELCDGKDNQCPGNPGYGQVDEGCPPPCSDNDVDGYYGQAGCGTAVDCNDNDSSIYPGAPENCTDSKDNDCNGFIDCDDSDCPPCYGPDLTSNPGGRFLEGPFSKKEGKGIKAKLVVMNQGDQDSGGFVVKTYLSYDTILDGGDTLRNIKEVKKLAVGDTKKVKIKIKDDNSMAGMYLISQIDANGEVPELRENNNLAVGLIP